MTHGQVSSEIRKNLRAANKSLTTAKRFGNTRFYNAGEKKLRHASTDIKEVGTYRISRVTAFRHIIGHSPEKEAGISIGHGHIKRHPPGCNCPFHGGHK